MRDRVWEQLRSEAEVITRSEPLLTSYVHTCILSHRSLGGALSFILSNQMADEVMSAMVLRELLEGAYHADPNIINCAAHDMEAVYHRDPAAKSFLSVLLNLKGFQSIQTHRLAHHLWHNGREELALFLQSRNSQVYGVDIHPAARIGKGVMFDHATGIVVGETAVIEDNVSILQSVTLGGTGNESGDRHPKVRSGVMIGAGAKVLGNIEVGEGAKIGAGSVVVNPVPPHVTVVGVPAKIIGRPGCDSPCDTMDQSLLGVGADIGAGI
ncbi:serine O-acetyltransferase [Ferrimonas balearica DSM 9799]|uniref:Serine acetyltransferase n=1 Tax=Ferrimonas balearica (strain DSM 9799 / CCM 4581 / KCTC 23876 / PAT) TaxID=550540 RepID=E1SNG3_FERBD|nr:serine O-acetyltransferase [Ferrimonas balearica]ADN75647.1 serine O-acetyltransferase [Ferrimonas balearica DSM 9799]MBW3138544.1 serine O-acetyltransferase [Ferrimonas balearica]MBW3163864.1 serine O-acetyltransferase [Ferrimonas balearica]MBY5979314.1 serine O-acetyltransferase [Ferrimonas balearica]MBY6105607.1 serine O-acetyltransferase [Ferrimonas balearica]